MNIITPFSRPENKDFYHKLFKGHKWHPIIHEDTDFEDWVTPFRVDMGDVYDPCYWKINRFLENGIKDDEQYVILNDDDSVEDGFFEKILKEDLIVVSMRRGDNQVGVHPTGTLHASGGNMRVGCVGLEQMAFRGSILKTLRFNENSHTADGELYSSLKGAIYQPDIFVLFNYLESGRYNK